MSGQSLTFGQMSLMDTPNATSSLGSVSGPTPSDKQDGPMIGQSGQAHAPANLSARQAKEAGSLMSGTSGPRGTISSESDALAWSLVSKLRPKTDSLGSTLYDLTWKARATPSGRSIYALRASARRTSGNGFTSWPTPQANNAERGGSEQRATNPERSNDLHDFALLAAWPTPMAVPDSEASHGQQSGQYRKQMDDLIGWTTPSSRDWKDTPGMATTATNPDGTERERLDQLPRQANLAAWPTPQSVDIKMSNRGAEATENEWNREHRGNNLALYAQHLSAWPTPNTMDGGQTSRGGERKDEMLMGGMVRPSPEGPARLTASGVMLTGSDAGMDGGGQLNPALPRWLQALPPEWDDCAVTAMPSTRQRHVTS